jgi:transposase
MLTVFRDKNNFKNENEMATRQQFKLSTEERRRRIFSEEFKQKKVREIEQKITTIAEVSRQYELRANSVTKWLKKYGNNYMKGVRTIVESESDTHKLVELKSKIAELERIIGQKQVQLDFKDKMIELAEETYNIDIKKKFGSKPLSGSGNTENSSSVV